MSQRWRSHTAPGRARQAFHAADPFGPRINRLALVTDAWRPQTNGVVNTLVRLVKHLELEGMEVMVVAPDAHFTLPLPSYPEIRVACDPWKAIGRIRGFAPDAIHVATEGPLGFSTVAWLRYKKLRFTTSFHTRYPEYLSARVPVVPGLLGLRSRALVPRARRAHAGELDVAPARAAGTSGSAGSWFTGPAASTPTSSTRRHRRDDVYAGLPGPIWLYVGRVAVEKSLEDFLKLPLPGTKVVVGDGPSREELQRSYPDVLWRGYQFGAELSAHFASADCFVFPSRTETFGNVILEALASGLPVASVPAPGPVDLVIEGRERRDRRRSSRRLSARAPLLARARPRQRRPADAAGRPRPLPRPPRPAAARDRLLRSAPGRGGLRPAADCARRILTGDDRKSGCPILMTAPWLMPSASENPSGANTMMVDPSSNQPISSPLRKAASQCTARGPSYARCSGTSRNRSRMLATRIEATGTRVTT